MEVQIAALTNRLTTLERISEERHRQNRDDINNLRSTFQVGFEKITDSFQGAMEKMSDRFERALEKNMMPLQVMQDRHGESIRKLEIKWGYATGYAAAGAVCGGIIFEVFKLIVDKAVHL